jgi:ABC-type multidrug transport system ATPase subunit
MRISLEQVGKRFQHHWIFRDISRTFAGPGAYALLGPNGSGKSTLMRIIAGMQACRPGRVTYTLGDKDIPANQVYPYISYCAPGMDIIDELTLRELLSFHFSFKTLLPGISFSKILEETGLQHMTDQPISDFSSGMKQRVKLAQAIFSDTPVLLLDEPCTNLDEAGVNRYQDWIRTHAAGRLVIVASNDPREYAFCREEIRLKPGH